MARYYTLATYEDGRWVADFGAYDRDDVATERDDKLDHGMPAKHLKIVSTRGWQPAILAAIDKLNGITAAP